MTDNDDDFKVLNMHEPDAQKLWEQQEESPNALTCSLHTHMREVETTEGRNLFGAEMMLTSSAFTARVFFALGEVDDNGRWGVGGEHMTEAEETIQSDSYKLMSAFFKQGNQIVMQQVHQLATSELDCVEAMMSIEVIPQDKS